MRLDEFDPSTNADDIGRGGGGGFGGGGGGGGMGILFSLLPMLFGRRMGCGMIALIAIAGLVIMSSGMLTSVSGPGVGSVATSGQSAPGSGVACDTAAELFACRVLKSTEIVWGQVFAANGSTYTPPRLEFYSEQNQSGCGVAQSAMGPFYCPADQKVYLDTAFFDELASRFGAAGDAAQAYVIAHEVGHHVQKLTGIADQVSRQQARASEEQSNALQVRMELQADCYAGVWAALARTPRTNQPVIEPGDIEEAMRAAQAVGDDTLQRAAGQRPVPESFTHGSSEQRMRWLQRGLQSHDPSQCDTFATNQL